MAPSPRPIPPVLGATAAPLTDEDLDTLHLVGDPDAEVPEAVARFTVTDDGAAEWCMRHVRRIDAELAKDQAQAAEWIAEVTEWLEGRKATAAGRRSFFAHHLEQYAVELRRRDPKAKTLTLPSGTVATTEKTPVVDFVEKTDAVVIDWLRDTYADEVLTAMEPIKVTESVLKTGLRKLVVIYELVVGYHDGQEVGRRWRPMLDEKGKVQPLAGAPGDSDWEEVVRRGAMPPVNPATGEPWADDVPFEDRMAPCLLVTEPTITATVKPAPVLS